MPLYDFKCPQCGYVRKDVLVKHRGDRVRCPTVRESQGHTRACGVLMRPLPSAAAFHFADKRPWPDE